MNYKNNIVEEEENSSNSSCLRSAMSSRGDSTIPFHRHCQATVLSANGTGEQNGASWSYIDNLTLSNLPTNWKDYFTGNRNNITQDLAGILQLIDACSGTNVGVVANSFTAGTEIGRITVDGDVKTLYSPTVSYSPTYTEDNGVEIGTITINGTSTKLYSPTSGESKINVPLLTPMWFDHKVSSSNWILSENTRDSSNSYGWLSGTTYPEIYQHLVDDCSSGTAKTNYTLATDGHMIIKSSANTNYDDTEFSSKGVSWYYVLDTTNKRFKLPRTKYGFQGIKDSVGTYDAPGLPNITGSIAAADNYYFSSLSNNAGTFITTITDNHKSDGQTRNVTTTEGHDGNAGGNAVNFSASRSNSIYGNSATVQPPATEMYLYFFTGEEIRTTGGGVMDGTVLSQTGEIEYSLEQDSGTVAKLVYTVQNDCGLMIRHWHNDSGYENCDWGIKCYLDESKTKPLYGTVDERDKLSSNPNVNGWQGSIFNLKKGTKIYATSIYNVSNKVRIQFIEYKLNTIQIDSESYVIERGRFCSADGTKHSTSSENDSWYTLYSDGWCEQGGRTTIPGANGVTVKLYKTYSDTSYSITATSLRDASSELTSATRLGSSPYVSSCEASSIVFDYNNKDYEGEIFWESKGFTESSDDDS